MKKYLVLLIFICIFVASFAQSYVFNPLTRENILLNINDNGEIGRAITNHKVSTDLITSISRIDVELFEKDGVVLFYKQNQIIIERLKYFPESGSYGTITKEGIILIVRIEKVNNIPVILLTQKFPGIFVTFFKPILL